MSFHSLFWSLFRICLIWLSLYGYGSLVKKTSVVKRNFRSIPAVIAGFVVYILLTVLLSLFDILSRTVFASFIVTGAVVSLAFLSKRVINAKYMWLSALKKPISLPSFLIAVFVVFSVLLLAGRPELNFNDTQVTYLVQPDRWLDSGHIYYIEETVFSGFPLVSEILLVLPCSLSSNRFDQLIMGQLFQMSMLIALVLVSMRILKFDYKWYPIAVISICGCTILIIWSHFAKPDSTALFFVTVSLSILLKQYGEPQTKTDLSPYLVMGMALATKITAYLALIPFFTLVYMVQRKNRYSLKHFLRGILLISLFPLAFAVRTFIHTGSPFYPHAVLNWFLKPYWEKPDYRLTYDVFNDRSSHFFPQYGFLTDIWHYFSSWGVNLFLLIAGMLTAFVNRHRIFRLIPVLVSIFLYASIAMILFHPSWWGAKYGILLIPFAALLGLTILREYSKGFIVSSIITISLFIVYNTQLSPTERYGFSFFSSLYRSYYRNEWSYDEMPMIETQHELRAIIWMNEHIPDSSNVLSLYDTKRYFSDHDWYVLWRHPYLSRILLDNAIEEELQILHEVDIDYIFISERVESHPIPFDGENKVEILKRIGADDLLEPLASIDGYVLMEVNYR
ncbi:MAG: hypothetical protein GF388_11155 [Candidatus Aegiribacteria sp.]|nr:hypothetical protein [Candidatus Aegiribacteria sp.]